MNKEDWFSVPIYYRDNIDVDIYEKRILELSKEEGIKKSNAGGWHSKDIKDDVFFKPLIDIIQEEANQVWLDFNPNKKGRFVINSMWSIINKKDNYNMLHNHPGGVISGSIYIKSNKDSGKIQFDNPLGIYKMLEYAVTESDCFYTWREISYDTPKGRLIFFPSYVKHHVTPNKSDEDRIVIAFNMMSEFD